MLKMIILGTMKSQKKYLNVNPEEQIVDDLNKIFDKLSKDNTNSNSKKILTMRI